MTDEEVARYKAIGFCVNLLVNAVSHINHREARRAFFIQGLDTIAQLLGRQERMREHLEASFDYENVED